MPGPDARGGTATADQPDQATWAEAMAAARAAYLTSPEAQTAATRDSLFKPFDSGPIDGQGPAKQVVVDVTGLKELRLVTKCEKSPANCNIWGEPKLIAKDGTVTRLTTLKPTSVKVGWGQLLLDKNWQDHPLRVGDRTFEFGLWVHADSELCFALDGRYERFEAHGRRGSWTAPRAWCVSRCSSAATPPPAVWADVASKFPTQAGWLRSDAGSDGIASWFGNRETAGLEQEILDTVLEQIQPADAPFQAEAEALTSGQRRRRAIRAGSASTPGPVVTASACRCSAPSRPCRPDLDALVAAQVPDDDPRWDALRARAVQAAELDDQFATLQFDIRQRDELSKPTGERIWNGERYVPAELRWPKRSPSRSFTPHRWYCRRIAIRPTSSCDGRQPSWPT